MKLSTLLLILFLLLGLLATKPSGEIEIIRDGHKTYEIKNAVEERIYALTLFTGGFLNLSIKIHGFATSSCGNLAVFFHISVKGKIPTAYNDLLLSLKSMDDVPTFYGFHTANNTGINAIGWSGDYDGGLITQTWSPRTAYNGFMLTSNYFQVDTEGFWNIKDENGAIRIEARLPGELNIISSIELKIVE